MSVTLARISASDGFVRGGLKQPRHVVLGDAVNSPLWTVGYAPPGWTNLTDCLSGQGFQGAGLLASGSPASHATVDFSTASGSASPSASATSQATSSASVPAAHPTPVTSGWLQRAAGIDQRWRPAGPCGRSVFTATPSSVQLFGNTASARTDDRRDPAAATTAKLFVMVQLFHRRWALWRTGHGWDSRNCRDRLAGRPRFVCASYRRVRTLCGHGYRWGGGTPGGCRTENCSKSHL